MIKTNFDLSEQARVDALALIAAGTTDQLVIDEAMQKGFIATGIYSGNYPAYKNFFQQTLNTRATVVRLKAAPLAVVPAVTPETPEPAPTTPAA